MGNAGIDAYAGIAVETIYGTYVAPQTYFEFDSESISLDPQYTTSMGLRAGRLAPPVARHRETTRDGGGSLSLKVPNKGFGKFLDMLHGNAVTPAQQASSAAYLQTHAVGLTRPNAKSRSILINKPSVEDGDQRVAAVGCVFESMGFSMEMGGDLNCEITVDARDTELDKSSVTPTYGTDLSSFLFPDVELEIEGDAIDTIVGSFSTTLPMPFKADRWGLGTGALKRRPIVNDYVRPTLSLSAEFTNRDLVDAWRAGEALEVVARFNGQNIESTYDEMLEFTYPAVKLTGTLPSVGGPDVLSLDVPAEVYDSGSAAPVTIKYQSVDTTL